MGKADASRQGVLQARQPAVARAQIDAVLEQANAGLGRLGVQGIGRRLVGVAVAEEGGGLRGWSWWDSSAQAAVVSIDSSTPVFIWVSRVVAQNALTVALAATAWRHEARAKRAP